MRSSRQHVILLHGLARTSRSMRKLEKVLRQAGYETLNLNYPSRKADISQLSKTIIPAALEQIPANAVCHFVTHSLGGIVLRQYLYEHSMDKLERVVMLGPPNHGSEVADWLQPFSFYHWFFGPVAAQLVTGDSGLPSQLGEANFEVGIIAGTQAVNILCAPFLPKPNDGIVSVASTRLKGMQDHLCLPVTHPFMMRHPAVIQQVLLFLQTGRFRHHAASD